MDRALEAFAEGEAARKEGYHAAAVGCYREALSLSEHSSRLEVWRVHHALGVSLTKLSRFGEASTELNEALIHAPQAEIATIARDLAICMLRYGCAEIALGRIEESLRAIPLHEYEERGASISVRAQIKLKLHMTREALEDFGLADSLLRRGENRVSEIENLLCFMEALVGNGESRHAIDRVMHAQRLIRELGSQTHRAKLIDIVRAARMEQLIEQIDLADTQSLQGS